MYLVLDCETATLPFIKQMEISADDKQKIGIAKPLIYDIGWVLCKNDGTIKKRVSYLVQETFFVPQVFNTAYYCEKRPMYMEKLAKGEIKAKLWNDIAEELLRDCRKAKFVSAYNAMFDFIKAIPFTEKYIKALYSDNYNKWEKGQRYACECIANNDAEYKKYCEKFTDEKDLSVFAFRDEKFPVVDIWRIACEYIINNFNYKDTCARFPMITASGRYFKTSAETVFRYISDDYDFDEEHTALSDATIENDIIRWAVENKIKPDIGISAFPFRELGTTYDFIWWYATHDKDKLSVPAISNVLATMTAYCDTCENYYTNTFAVRLMKEVKAIEIILNNIYHADVTMYRPDFELVKEVQRKQKIYNRTKQSKLREQLADEIDALQYAVELLNNI